MATTGPSADNVNNNSNNTPKPTLESLDAEIISQGAEAV